MATSNHPLSLINFSQPNLAYVIEASAGTGKTWTIERLFIKALLEAAHPVDPLMTITIENILVVTFTNDASNELKERIQEQIQDTINNLIYLHNQPDEANNLASDIFFAYILQRAISPNYIKDVAILSRALQNFDLAAIYTIHGFCNKILHDYQFDCLVNSDFELLASKRELIKELVRNFMRSEILSNPDFSSSITTVMANLERLFSSDIGDLDLLERISLKIPQDVFIIQNGEYKLKYSVPVTASLQKLTQLEFSQEDARQAKAEFLAYLLNYLQEHFGHLAININQISYDELIGRVADSLTNSKSLSDKLFESFPIAFIDEFQDTDLLQWQIFSSIYRLNDAARGNVVVVGDPKQAIYRFRGADVDTYLDVCRQISQHLDLKINFRSHPDIMNFINQLFSLENQNQTIENSFLGNGINYLSIEAAAKYTDILPSANELRAQTEKKGVTAEFFDEAVHLLAINGITKAERKNKLLMALTFEILALLNADSSLAGKIAILVTKNREANEVVSYLKKYGIRAAELKLGNIYASQTALEIYTILNSVIDIANRRNFIKALSCNIFNLPLMVLNSANWNYSQELEKFQQRFFHYKLLWDKEGIISLVYTLINDLIQDNPEKLVLTNRELANIWQLAELLNLQNNKLAHQHELLFWFKQKIKNAESNLGADIDGNNDELIRLDNDDEQIIITTQHKSKGLEYDILFCPFFKNSSELDGTYDYNYRRPFFSQYRKDNKPQQALIMDQALGEDILITDNKEAHRLNYVALTRAKRRIYIYLKQNSLVKATGKYNQRERPDKIIELFGYVKDDPCDTTHTLFNYPQFFSNTPEFAIKASAQLPGVCVYNRDKLSVLDLNKLKLMENSKQQTVATSLQLVNPEFNTLPDYVRQSYTRLTVSQKDENTYAPDYYQKDEIAPFSPPLNRYSILDDPELSGAKFGILFHELCEKYPFNESQLQLILLEHNISFTENDYVQQLMDMLQEAFSYNILPATNLSQLLIESQHELEFNLLISKACDLSDSISQLLSNYFGVTHPFSTACKTLGQVSQGFLIGFIDLVFKHKNKYWVLDYKTNRLEDYSSPTTYCDESNGLISSMADHHYYLQYLLYLVAVKRYLQKKLSIEDASDLLGGAIYYYVRGIYTTDITSSQGIYIDNNCQNLVRDLDLLLSGVANV